MSTKKRTITININNTSTQPTSVIKVIPHKKQDVGHAYNIIKQKQYPREVKHVMSQVSTPSNLKLFYYQNYCCQLDQESGYLYLHDNITHPIGRIVNESRDVGKKIEWYFMFDLDTMS